MSAGHAEEGSPPVTVVRGVTFGLRPGGKLLFLGRSGSGKSTLLRVLNRLSEPLSGVVLENAVPTSGVDPRELRRRVALVAQKPTVFEGSVRENLCAALREKATPDEAALRVLLSDVGLDGEGELIDRDARSLSVGEQQRVCLSRALVTEPRILLLDEPTSSLDPRSLGVVSDLVLALAERRSLTLVVATHQPELAQRIDAPALLFDAGTTRLGDRAEVATFFRGGA